MPTRYFCDRCEAEILKMDDVFYLRLEYLKSITESFGTTLHRLLCCRECQEEITSFTKRKKQ